MKFLPLNFLSVMLLLLLSSCNSTAQDAGFTDIPPGGLAGFLEGNDAVILDVRTPGEWDAGKVESALTINLGHPQFNQSIAQLDRETTYLVYCNSGNRSRIASRRMVEMGFTSVYNYNGYHYQIRREYEELGNQPSR
jgi:phage shock protein E